MRLSVPAEGGREGGRGGVRAVASTVVGGEAGKRARKDWDDAGRRLRRGGRTDGWWRELRTVADRVGGVDCNI